STQPRPFLCLSYRSAAHPDLHSFPTRRSSDLPDPMDLQRLRDDEADALAPVQRGERILEDHHHLAPDRAHLLAGEVRDVASAERSEEHTSELQSLAYLVCRLLLEKKKIPQPDR